MSVAKILQEIIDKNQQRHWTATDENPETHWEVMDGQFAILARQALAEYEKEKQAQSEASWRFSELRPVVDSYGQFTDTWR